MASFSDTSIELPGTCTRGEDQFCCVEENLYIGSYQSVCLFEAAHHLRMETQRTSDSPDTGASISVGKTANECLAEAAVLTVDSRRLPKELTQCFHAYKFINVDDSLQFEFVPHFQECCDFIRDHRNRNKAVFVHW